MLNALGTAVKQASGFTPYNPANIGYDYADFRSQFITDEHTTSVNSAVTGFSSLYDHTRSGNATMVDSDGVLKWAPHNLLAYSEDFTQSAWVKQTSATVTANQAAAPNGTLTADLLSFSAASNSQIRYDTPSLQAGSFKLKVWARSESGSELFALSTYNATDGSRNSADFALTEEWALYEFDITNTVTTGFGVYIKNASDAAARNIYIWGAHLYRSDLGGMVNNPDRGDSYVPTTSAAKYLPRLNHHKYNGYEWVNKGVLVESEARTNLVTYSSEFDNAAWFKSRTSTSSNPSSSPTGQQVYSLIEDGTSAEHYARLRITKAASPLVYTATIFAKRGTGTRNIAIGITDGSTGGYATIFNIDDGSIVLKDQAIGTTTSWVVGDASAVNYGDGWWRFSYSVTTNSAAQLDMVLYLVSGTTRAYVGDATSNHLISGAQLEQASVPSSYIPTSGATATRAADTLTIPYEYLPKPRTNALSIQMKGEMDYADEGAFATATFVRWRLDASNLITNNLSTNSTDTGRVYFIQVNAGVTDQVLSAGASYTPGLNVPFNIASRHGSTFINGAVDGTALTADLTPVALPDLTTTDLALADDFIGTIEEFRVWSSDLGDTGISDASEPSLVPSLNLTFDGASTSFTHTELTS